MTTPFADKDPSLVVRSVDPPNAEPPLDRLVAARLTPNDLFFVRTHGSEPELDADAYRLEVGGLVENPLALSRAELLDRFATATVEATLQCAGNRRAQLAEQAPIPAEVPWDDGAIGNGTFTGVRLRDLLEMARVGAEARHVELLGHDTVEEDGETVRFGGSIPLEKALEADVLLAYEMNGAPLLRAHGAPLRVVVPGYIGARSVKWLSNVTLRREPSDAYFQARSYKLFPPGESDADALDWGRGLMLGEVSTNCAICRPARGARLRAGAVTVRGWALGSGSRTVERVDVSGDGGATWITASFDDHAHRHSWRLWRAGFELAPGRTEIVARAWDSAANTQPEDPARIWNLKGYVNNAWPRVRVEVRDRPA